MSRQTWGSIGRNLVVGVAGWALWLGCVTLLTFWLST